jgi:hypothetical protein
MCLPIAKVAALVAEALHADTVSPLKFCPYVLCAFFANLISFASSFHIFEQGYEALLFRTKTKRTNRKESSGRDAPDDLVSLANARRSHFVRTDLGEAELDAGDAASRRLQLQAITDRNEGSFEQICKLLQKLFGSHDVKRLSSSSSLERHHSEALKFFKALTKMKEEFVSMLQYVSKHRDYVSALDELSMSFSRMVAAAPGERIDPSEEHFKMHLIEAPERLATLAATHSEGYAKNLRSKFVFSIIIF